MKAIMSSPLCCSPAAYAAFARQIPVIESTEGLLRAAILLALHHEEPHRDVQACVEDVERTLSGYAKIIRSRVRGPQVQAMLAHLHQYLFEDLGFVGNNDDYYNPSNSYLPDVIESKRGLPITLALIYRVVGEKLGLTVRGVGLPGHFINAVTNDTGRLFIDCFASGRVLTPDECKKRVESIFADTVEWNDQMLQPVTHRMWLSRLIQNLLHIFTTNQQWNDVAAMLELQMLLWPKQAQLQRDLALVLARIDMPKPACRWLDSYLRANPNDPERDELAELLEKLSR